MANFDEYTYTIGDHFLPSLINGDDTGLDDHDIEQLELFLNCDRHTSAGHWAIPDSDQYPDLDRCDITGLLSNCVQVSFFKLIEEN